MPLKLPVTGVDCARGGVAGDNIAGEGEDTAAGGGDAPFAGDPSSRENISPFCLFYRVE